MDRINLICIGCGYPTTSVLATSIDNFKNGLLLMCSRCRRAKMHYPDDKQADKLLELDKGFVI